MNAPRITDVIGWEIDLPIFLQSNEGKGGPVPIVRIFFDRPPTLEALQALQKSINSIEGCFQREVGVRLPSLPPDDQEQG